MTSDLKSGFVKGFSVLLVIAFIYFSNVKAEELDIQVKSTILTVYRDGLVHVNHTLVVNETLPIVDLQLLASSVENVLVLDENETFLDYDVSGLNMTLYTLGARSVFLEYDTVSLSMKEADVWTLILNNPYNVTLYLPEESTVIYLSNVPDSIETEGNRIALSLFPATWEISYVLSVPLPSPADFRVSNLRIIPAEVMTEGEITVSVLVTNVGERAGSYTVILKINQATEETKNVTLEGGKSTVVEFKVTKKDPGTYTVNIAGVSDEFSVKASAVWFPIEYLVMLGGVVVAIVLAVFIVVRRRHAKPSVDKIFRINPYLRQEDKDVIQFLADKGGRAFEAEIRERFQDMPRTSLWRLVKRLEKFEIVKVKRIGLENQVELKK